MVTVSITGDLGDGDGPRKSCEGRIHEIAFDNHSKDKSNKTPRLSESIHSKIPNLLIPRALTGFSESRTALVNPKHDSSSFNLEQKQTQIIFERKPHINGLSIKKALEELEKTALQSKLFNKKSSKLKDDETKKCHLKLYNFLLPDPESESVRVKCPPFDMLLEHTLTVVWHEFSHNIAVENNRLQFPHLAWALFFLRSLGGRRKHHRPAPITACIRHLERRLTKVTKDGNKVSASGPLAGGISVEDVVFKPITEDSPECYKIQLMQNKGGLTKEGRDILAAIVYMLTEMGSRGDFEHCQYKSRVYRVIESIDKLDYIFNDIMSQMQKLKIQLLSSFRMEHGKLAVSLGSLEKDLQDTLQVRASYKNTQHQMREMLNTIVSMKDFLNLLRKRSTVENKFNTFLDTSFKKLRRLRRSIDDVPQCIYTKFM